MNDEPRFHEVRSGWRLASCGICCAVIVDDEEGANRRQHVYAVHSEVER